MPQVFLCHEKRGMGRLNRDNAPPFLEKNCCAQTSIILRFIFNVC